MGGSSGLARVLSVEDLGEYAVTHKGKDARLASELHRRAMREGANAYLDPASGLHVFTSDALRARECCGNRCRHCPHGHVNCAGKSPELEW
mmetsp:Transcript_18182/g.59404  ORF Transcript_18182/g.59404 Transcript_18182/m.59404 type:complete len:91 (+) Transcript_18182:167-439(+)